MKKLHCSPPKLVTEGASTSKMCLYSALVVVAVLVSACSSPMVHVNRFGYWIGRPQLDPVVRTEDYSTTDDSFGQNIWKVNETGGITGQMVSEGIVWDGRLAMTLESDPVEPTRSEVVSPVLDFSGWVHRSWQQPIVFWLNPTRASPIEYYRRLEAERGLDLVPVEWEQVKETVWIRRAASQAQLEEEIWWRPCDVLLWKWEHEGGWVPEGGDCASQTDRVSSIQEPNTVVGQLFLQVRWRVEVPANTNQLLSLDWGDLFDRGAEGVFEFDLSDCNLISECD